MKKFAALVAVLALVAFAAPAFAANPFMDVPMNHWAYDAVSQLASRGVVSGYPDGAFKGEWKATRYEMASIVARALAYVDMNKASKQDLELLKKLVVEFKDELDALGVKVDELDSRVAVLEDRLGGWKINGWFRFDSKWADNNDGAFASGASVNNPNDTTFNNSRYRIQFTKYIDDKVTFVGRTNGSSLRWHLYYLDIVMPWDSVLTIGRYLYDWEGDDALYNDNDAWFTDEYVDAGYTWRKDFSMGAFYLMYNHKDETGDYNWFGADNDEVDTYGGRFVLNFNEQLSMTGNYLNYDFANDDDYDTDVWWAQVNVNFTPAIALRGAYFDESTDGVTGDQNAWKAILDVKQDAFKFTSLWIEYIDMDEEFLTRTGGDGYDYDAGDTLVEFDDFGGPMTPYVGHGAYDANVLFARLDQQWNDKWATHERFGQTDIDSADDLDTTFWSFHVTYWYTPALSFDLSYQDVDYGDDAAYEDDSMVMLRTYVAF